LLINRQVCIFRSFVPVFWKVAYWFDFCYVNFADY
jgi:hypothetical protein